jgi:hypothetical protein
MLPYTILLRSDPTLGPGNRIGLVGIEIGIREHNKIGWDQNGIIGTKSKDRSRQALIKMLKVLSK